MRIGIYVDTAKEAQLRGIGFHIVNLLQALGRLDRQNEYLLYYQCGLLERASAFRHRPEAPNFHLRPVRFPRRFLRNHPSLWWDHYLPRAIRRDRVDVFHSPNFILPAVEARKTVFTVHDLAFFKMDLYAAGVTAILRQRTMQALQRAERVIAISKNTQADIEALGIPPEKVRLVYCGGNVVPDKDIQAHRQDEVRRAFNLPEKYILYLGNLAPRKNVPFLLRGYAQLKRGGHLPHRLVLVGKKYDGFEEMDRLMRELGIEQDVIITGYADAWQVPLLYQMADLFVLPTLYEGFTLVTIEAMAYGVPVISTETSSIREGVGDAGILVPVNDVDALAGSMRAVLTDRKLHDQLIERGKAQAQKFTWDQTARGTLAVYQEVFAAAAPGARRLKGLPDRHALGDGASLAARPVCPSP